MLRELGKGVGRRACSAGGRAAGRQEQNKLGLRPRCRQLPPGLPGLQTLPGLEHSLPSLAHVLAGMDGRGKLGQGHRGTRSTWGVQTKPGTMRGN